MAARTSAVSTLHARLKLPSSFSHNTLERCLIDSTVQGKPTNASLAAHGNVVLGYYVSDYLMTRYPRLPYRVLKSALISYVGWRTLADVGRGWGVEAQPKQDKRVKNTTLGSRTTTDAAPVLRQDALLELNRVPRGQVKGRLRNGDDESEATQYLQTAYGDFVRAVVGGLHLQSGTTGVRQFIDHHFLSRHLDLIRTFKVNQPQRELVVLCAREGLERPTTRLIAETGRRTKSPVFVLGVYSGADQLGEGQASSMKEAEYLAQSNAMKSWYLYEDRKASLPYMTSEGEETEYRQPLLDVGDIFL